MKKLIAALFGVASLSVFGGGLNTYDGITYTNLIESTAVPVATAITGTARNVSALKGNGTVIVNVTPGVTNVTTYGVTVQVQDSETGTTAWSNVASVVAYGFTNVGKTTVIKLDTATVRKYLRVVATATNDSGYVDAILAGYR